MLTLCRKKKSAGTFQFGQKCWTGQQGHPQSQTASVAKKIQHYGDSCFLLYDFSRDYRAVADAFPRRTSPPIGLWTAVWWEHQLTAEGLLEWKPWPPTTIWVDKETAERHQPRQVGPLICFFTYPIISCRRQCKWESGSFSRERSDLVYLCQGSM